MPLVHGGRRSSYAVTSTRKELSASNKTATASPMPAHRLITVRQNAERDPTLCLVYDAKGVQDSDALSWEVAQMAWSLCRRQRCEWTRQGPVFSTHFSDDDRTDGESDLCHSPNKDGREAAVRLDAASRRSTVGCRPVLGRKAWHCPNELVREVPLVC